MYSLRQQAANLARAGSHTLPARCSEPAPVLLSATRLVPPTKETRGRTETVYSCHPPGCYQYLPRLLSPVRFPVVGRLKCVKCFFTGRTVRRWLPHMLYRTLDKLRHLRVLQRPNDRPFEGAPLHAGPLPYPLCLFISEIQPKRVSGRTAQIVSYANQPGVGTPRHSWRHGYRPLMSDRPRYTNARSGPQAPGSSHDAQQSDSQRPNR